MLKRNKTILICAIGEPTVITIFYSHEKFEGKVWAGLYSLKEKKTTAGQIKMRKFSKDDVLFYGCKNHTQFIYLHFFLKNMH